MTQPPNLPTNSLLSAFLKGRFSFQPQESRELKYLGRQIHLLGKSIGKPDFAQDLRQRLLVKIGRLPVAEKQTANPFFGFWRRMAVASTAFLIVLIFIINLFQAPPAEALPVATLKVLSGNTVEVKITEAWQKVSEAILLKKGDQIRVGQNSEASLEFLDDSRAVLSADTEVAIDDYKKLNSDAKKVFVAVRLNSGKIQAQVHKDPLTPANFEVRTDKAAVSARNAVFDVEITDSGETKVSSAQNTVEVKLATAPEAPIELKVGLVASLSGSTVHDLTIAVATENLAILTPTQSGAVQNEQIIILSAEELREVATALDLARIKAQEIFDTALENADSKTSLFYLQAEKQRLLGLIGKIRKTDLDLNSFPQSSEALILIRQNADLARNIQTDLKNISGVEAGRYFSAQAFATDSAVLLSALVDGLNNSNLSLKNLPSASATLTSPFLRLQYFANLFRAGLLSKFAFEEATGKYLAWTLLEIQTEGSLNLQKDEFKKFLLKINDSEVLKVLLSQALARFSGLVREKIKLTEKTESGTVAGF